MPPQYLIDFVNVYGGATSLIVGFISIWLSVVFYLSAKTTESKNAELLASIKISVETLNTINNTLLGKAIQHLADSNSKMINALMTNEQYEQNIEKAETSKRIFFDDVDSKGLNLPKDAFVKPDIRKDIMREIHSLIASNGKAVAIIIFSNLKDKYEFMPILFELKKMHDEGLVNWPESPNAPDALSEITLT